MTHDTKEVGTPQNSHTANYHLSTHDTGEVEEKDIIKFVIDIVWEATDGGVRMTPNQFSHFEEPLGALTDFQTYFHHQLKKAREGERERAVEIIRDELRTAPIEVQMTKGIVFANIIGRIHSELDQGLEIYANKKHITAPHFTHPELDQDKK